MFTGTTRVAQELKRRGAYVTAIDSARYSFVFANCHIVTEASLADQAEIQEILNYLAAKPGIKGYFTDTFCHESRFFQPFNGEKIDAIREAVSAEFSGSKYHDILLTSLIYAADKVDSTVGLQMAYIKEWAPRSYKPLKLEIPELFAGSGRALRGDACQLVNNLDSVDFAYLDPPYNQHSYYTNYHIWETLVAWDRPERYGIACKREDAKSEANKSVFNSSTKMPQALASLVGALSAKVIVLSYNNEAWVSLDELVAMCSHLESVQVLAFDSRRYVGAKIGIYNPQGAKVGSVSHLRNLEYLVLAGEKEVIEYMTTPYEDKKVDFGSVSVAG
jgi:adenine-specific DNA-methyltransferase